MFLTKDGITVEVTHPSDIRRYRSLGYVEVASEKPQVDEKSVKVSRPKNVKPSEKPQVEEKDGES